MNDIEFESAPLATTRPKTATVFALLIAAAGIISYLCTFALTNALVAADVLKPFSRDHDPRLKWFALGFTLLIAIFTLIGGAMRHYSAKSLKKLAEMEQD